MHFTLFFEESNADVSTIYQMVYTPCVTWYKNGSELFVASHRGQYFEKGDFLDLINLENIEGPRQVAIIVHQGGHGTESDLNALIDEIKGFGLKWKILA